MDWSFVVVVYESSGQSRGYLRWSFANVRWELTDDRRRADRWHSESAAAAAREQYLVEGPKVEGYYAAVEQRRFNGG